MNLSSKIFVVLATSAGLLTMGSVIAQGVTNHQVNLKVGGMGPANRHYPALDNPGQERLHVNRYDTIRFHFPGRPSETSITIRSQDRINQSVGGSPPYEYNGRAGIEVNPDEGVYEIKYDVIVSRADMEFEVLDPMIIVDD